LFNPDSRTVIRGWVVGQREVSVLDEP
jgi:hypothetical protein